MKHYNVMRLTVREVSQKLFTKLTVDLTFCCSLLRYPF